MLPGKRIMSLSKITDEEYEDALYGRLTIFRHLLASMLLFVLCLGLAIYRIDYIYLIFSLMGLIYCIEVIYRLFKNWKIINNYLEQEQIK